MEWWERVKFVRLGASRYASQDFFEHMVIETTLEKLPKVVETLKLPGNTPITAFIDEIDEYGRVKPHKSLRLVLPEEENSSGTTRSEV